MTPVSTPPPQRQGSVLRASPFRHALILPLVLGSLATSAVAAPTLPASDRGATLYYRLGGSDAAARAPNPSNLSLRLGLSGAARLNYSCGKFSASFSLQNTLNAFASLGPVITAAVQAGIAALPMYILQRAQPGLYELIQTYIKKAEDLVSLSFASCEQMEQLAKDGKNPYDKFVSLAMGEAWKSAANSGSGDVVQTKQAVQTSGGANGFTWVFGSVAGGSGQPPARLVNDTVTASYNLTMMQPTTASPSANYAATGTRLGRAFPTPAAAATYATEVIGDLEVATCGDGGCPAKATRTSLGLERKVEEEMPLAKTQLTTALATSVPASATLESASAPGVLVTRDLIEALRVLPATEQTIAVEKLSQEIALARTVDRALLVRQLLVTGLTIPEALPPQVADEVQAKIAQVNRAIDDLLFETRVRKEVLSGSASTLLEAYRAAQSASVSNTPAAPRERRPFVDGRVQ